MLTLTDINTYYGKSHILQGVSMEVKPGEVVGLLGRNGVGKSTTLKTIMGLVRPAGGRIAFEGHDIAGAAPYRLARTITVLHYCEVLAEGSPAEIQGNPRVQEVYLKT